MLRAVAVEHRMASADYSKAGRQVLFVAAFAIIASAGACTSSTTGTGSVSERRTVSGVVHLPEQFSGGVRSIPWSARLDSSVRQLCLSEVTIGGDTRPIVPAPCTADWPSGVPQLLGTIEFGSRRVAIVAFGDWQYRGFGSDTSNPDYANQGGGSFGVSLADGIAAVVSNDGKSAEHTLIFSREDGTRETTLTV